MRSWLILNTPWQGTGNRHEWSFSGRDHALLSECLDQLDGATTANPDDRWSAAIVFGFSDPEGVRTPKSAWTIRGALALARILPDQLGDLRADVLQRFAAREEGWLGDAHTPPRSSD